MTLNRHTTFALYVTLAALTASTGCQSGEVQDVGAASDETPRLRFGKADDGDGNTRLADALHPGQARDGSGSGFVALPVRGTAGDALHIQGWTSGPAVLYVFGPRRGAEWDLEQVRTRSAAVEPGVESRALSFEPTEDGEYLVVVGSPTGESLQWIVALGATGDTPR
jgi:hypothetical protein